MPRREIRPFYEFSPVRLVILLISAGFILLILFPVILARPGCSSIASNKSKSRVQLNMYCNALVQFESEYGYFPKFLDENGQINLSESGKSEQFIEALSGRGTDGIRAPLELNRKAIPFYSFSEQELKIDDDNGNVQIVDAYDNPEIIIVCDVDGDGLIQVEYDDELVDIRARVVAYTVGDSQKDSVNTWD